MPWPLASPTDYTVSTTPELRGNLSILSLNMHRPTPGMIPAHSDCIRETSNSSAGGGGGGGGVGGKENEAAEGEQQEEARVG